MLTALLGPPDDGHGYDELVGVSYDGAPVFLRILPRDCIRRTCLF